MFDVRQYLTNDEAWGSADQADNIANFDRYGLWHAGHAPCLSSLCWLVKYTGCAAELTPVRMLASSLVGITRLTYIPALLTLARLFYVRGTLLLTEMQTLLRDEPAQWRERAEEARRAASQSRGVDAFAEKTLLEIADAYEQLVRLAEAKLASGKS